MIIETAIIQVGEDLEYLKPSLCAAAFGFQARGVVTTKRTAVEIEHLPAVPNCLVFGGVEVVRPYLKKLGCDPAPIDYPLKLKNYLGRCIETVRLGELRLRLNSSFMACFIKPVEHKLFPGLVIERFSQLAVLAPFPRETLIYVSEILPFVSEWRCYVLKGEVVGIGHYLGDPLLFPNREIVAQAARDGAEEVPAACSLDFGVTREGHTFLIEANDMISLGSYGIKPELYAKLIETRWLQLVTP